MNYLEISFWHVAAAALLILINAGISLALKLNLEKTLLIAVSLIHISEPTRPY